MSVRAPIQVERLLVQCDIESASRPLGTLVWSRPERRAYFEYHPDFLAAPLPVSPFHLPATSGAKPAPAHTFDGLHGLFADSLPDGWGRKLLDRRLQAEGINPLVLSPLDRLAYVGGSGMGALRYEPESLFGKVAATGINLDLIADETEAVQRDLPTADITLLLRGQGGSGGVRPKLMIGLRQDRAQVLADTGSGLPAGFDAWIVKFRTLDEATNIGAEEYAYALMAQAAGVEMAEACLLETAKGRYFATRRFDRQHGQRRHVHTASGLLETSHTLPGIGYEELLKLTMVLTRDDASVWQMFRRMALNILAHNRDDHARNHAFIMAANGTWRPSPAYDVTFSSGPGGEHNLAVIGEGRAPTPAHMLRLAKKLGLAATRAKAIIDEVAAAIARWPDFADQARLAPHRMREIGQVISPR